MIKSVVFISGVMFAAAGSIAAAQTVAPLPLSTEVSPLARQVVLDADTFFDFDRSVLKPDSLKILNHVVLQTQEMELDSIHIIGHTDSTGADDYNRKLSERRANAVKNYLTSHGVPASHIYAQGEGKSQPVATNATSEGRAQNRRVEITILGKNS